MLTYQTKFILIHILPKNQKFRLLFHSILSKIVAYYFECLGWKLKNYVYQHLEIVCKCWLYLVNTRSMVQSKKEIHGSKKGLVLNLILS